MTTYLTVEQATTIHNDQLRRYGGRAGLRDAGLLESALFRPQTGHYADLIQEADALWESLSENHPFIDGNKRVSFAATDVFLQMNGLCIASNPGDTYEFIMGLHREGRFRLDNLEEWLRAHTKPCA